MKYIVTQVGRRWFKVKAEVSTFRDDIESIAVVVDVEATFYRHRKWSNYDYECEWTIVGLGSRKYRDGIIEAIHDRREFIERIDAERLPFS